MRFRGRVGLAAAAQVHGLVQPPKGFRRGSFAAAGAQFLPPGHDSYSAQDVLDRLLAEPGVNCRGTAAGQSSAYRAFSIAANRAAFSFRRFLALGFSKRRRSRNCCKVCSRSSFFLSRRIALSTGSPFLN